MTAPTVYTYDPATGEVVGSEAARVLPLREGLPDDDLTKWQIPADATLEPPPDVKAHEAACFRGGEWQVVSDYRGVAYARKGGREVLWRELGPLPDELTLVPPPSVGSVFDGEAWRPGGNLVDAERDHRLAAFDFNGVAYQLDHISQMRIIAMGADARFAMLAGAGEDDLRWADADSDFGWIAADNAVTPMDAPTMAAFADAAKLWVMAHTFAARALKDMNPIPADFAEDGWWPTAADP